MEHLTNINTFRMVCERTQEILEKYFKTPINLPNTVANNIDQESLQKQQCSKHAIEIDKNNKFSSHHHQEDAVVKHEIDIENSSYYTIIDYTNNNENNLPIEQYDPLSLDTG